MNNIITDLNKNNIQISLKVFDKQDLENEWEIKSIVEHPVVFECFYSKYQISCINDINDYYLYFLSIKLSSMQDLVEHIKDDKNKATIKNLSKEATDIIKTFDCGNVVKYINSHIEEIISSEHFFCELIQATADFIAKHLSGIDLSVVRYISENQKQLIIDRFNKFEKVIEDNPFLFDILIPSGKYNEIDPFRFDIILDIFRHIYIKEKTNLKEKVEEKILMLYEDIKFLIERANGKNAMQIESLAQIFNNFLIRICSPLANDFLFSVKKIEELLANSIKENGHTFKTEVPVKELISNIEKQKNPAFCILAFTHTIKYYKKIGKYVAISLLDSHSNNEDSLLNLVSTNFPKDEYFTFEHQMFLQLIARTEVGAFYYFLTDKEKVCVFTEMIIFVAKELEKNIVEYKNENILKDIEYLSTMIKNMSVNIDGDKEQQHIICYGLSIYSCSLIEKLLRIFYLHIMKNEIYIPLSHTTLGALFNERNSALIDIFGFDHIKNLSFFLIETGENNVGYNIRNSLAHLTDIKLETINTSFSVQILWLLIDVLNTIFAYSMFNDE